VTSKTLIRGGYVLTLGAKTANLAEGDVLVEDGTVVEVGPGLRDRDAEVVDASGTIVMPGFVDTHRHVWKSLFKSLGDGGSDGAGPVPAAVVGHHHRPEDVYAATLTGLLGAVEAGITTVVDWSDIQFDARYTDAALQAHADAGLRTVFVHSAPHWAESHEDVRPALRRLAGMSASAPGSPTTFAYGPIDPKRSDLDRAADEWALARELGLRIHAHAGSEASDRGVVSSLAERGLLGEDVTLVHCSHLDDAELDAIASTRTAVSVTPASDMAGGRGRPPTQQLIDRGIRPGLGVDDERVAPGDMFAQMRALISLQHATLFDLKLAGKGGIPNLLSTRDVIRYATLDGARTAGLGGVTGSIEPGKQADIVVLRADRPNVFPINDPIGAVVWGMDTSNLDSVFVAGRALMRGGVLQADVARARKLATAAQGRVGAAAGLIVGTVSGGER